MFEAEHSSLDEQRTQWREEGGLVLKKSQPENSDVAWMAVLTSVSSPE